MKTWFSIANVSEDAAEISIYDEIGGWGITAKDFLHELKAVGDRKISLRINSPGGSVFDGTAIYNRLKDHKGGVEVKIDGIAASMASVIAMAGTKVIMPSNALMMIHNPSGLVWGESEDMREMADLLDKLKGSLVGAYERRSNKSREELEALMDAETWFSAQEALDAGLIDEISDALPVAASLAPEVAARFGFLKAPAAEEEAEPEASLDEVLAAIGAKDTLIGSLTSERDTAIGERDSARTEVATLKVSLTAAQAKADLYEKLKANLRLKPAARVVVVEPEDDFSQMTLAERYEKATPEEQLKMMEDPEMRRELMEHASRTARPKHHG